MRNANKCQKNLLLRHGEENEKLTRNPHTDPDDHQQLISFRGSPFAHACQVRST